MREYGKRASMVVSALIALVFTGSVQAQSETPISLAPKSPLVTIYDSGESLPMAPYISHLLAGNDQPGVLPGLVFPLRSQLRPAVLAADQVQVFAPRWMTQPVFVVGDDDISLKWLRHNEGKLRHMGAWGLVVQARDARHFKGMQKLFEGMPLAPVQSPWLEQRLIKKGAGVFPLLIQADGVARQIVPSQAGGSMP
jgi:integrating conjugative element protein (TIGR03765 family)